MCMSGFGYIKAGTLTECLHLENNLKLYWPNISLDEACLV